MTFPKIVYNPGTGAVTLTFKRGPLDLLPEWAPRLHDAVATSGAARERVVENLDILIGFSMPALVAGDDLAAWMSFYAYALGGGSFQFYPQADKAAYYNCVDEAGAWQCSRVAMRVYSAGFKFRVLQDAQAPVSPGAVLEAMFA